MSKFLIVLMVALFVVVGFFMVGHLKDSVDPLSLKGNGSEKTLKSDRENNKFSSTEEYFNTWREFIAPSGNFKVLFPSFPQHVTQQELDPKTQEKRKYETFIVADENGTVFMISVITYLHGLDEKKVEEKLKSAVTDMQVRNKENQLKEMHASKFDDHKAVDFSLVNGDLLVTGKVFANQNVIYMLNIVNKSEGFHPEELAFFLNSFKIINDSQNSSTSPKKI